MAGPYFRKRSWPPFVYQGVTYGLTHLDEYVFSVVDANGNQRRHIAVTFEDHCFTRFPAPGDDRALVYPTSDRRPGHFCFERYTLSLGLREHIANATAGDVWNVVGGNFAAVPVVDHSGKRLLYGIIFSLDRVSGLPVHLHMRVETAYPVEQKELVTFGHIRFPYLVALRMKHERPRQNTSRHRKKPKVPR